MASYGPDPSKVHRGPFTVTDKVLMVVTRSRREGSAEEFRFKQTEKLLKQLPKEKLEALRQPLLEEVKKKFSRRRYRDPSAPGTYPKMLSQELRNSIEVTSVQYGDTSTMGTGMTGFAIRTIGKDRATNKLAWLSDPAKPWHTSQGKRLAIPVSMEAKKLAARGKGPLQLGKKLELFGYRKKGEYRYMLIEYRGHSPVSGKMLMTVHYVLWKGQLNLAKRRGLDDAVAGCEALIKRIIEKPWI